MFKPQSDHHNPRPTRQTLIKSLMLLLMLLLCTNTCEDVPANSENIHPLSFTAYPMSGRGGGTHPGQVASSINNLS